MEDSIDYVESAERPTDIQLPIADKRAYTCSFIVGDVHAKQMTTGYPLPQIHEL